MLSTFLGAHILDDFTILDTLILSRLLNYNQDGGHSLEAWGNFFKYPKSKFDDFSEWSQELEDRCIVDTEINAKLYKYLEKYINNPVWQDAIRLEHETAFFCNDLHNNGFPFNLERAKELHDEINEKVSNLLKEFQSIFPPVSRIIREITPVGTRSGALHSKDFRWHPTGDLTSFGIGQPFSLFEWEEFNPNSTKQRVERLNAAGWRPYNKTKGHIEAERNKDFEKLKKFKVYGWTVDEENLATLPEDAPEGARKLAEYLLLSNRLSDLVEWINLYNPATGAIHPTVNGIGSWSHRKSHQKPNSANIPSLVNRKGKPQPYGAEFRSLWRATEGKKLVGCDAEGIQLRLFAHYCNDPRLIAAIEKGVKEQKTDIHSLNLALMHPICNSRDSAKTYIYALLLGAGIKKQAAILNCTVSEAALCLTKILDFYPGWKQLKDKILKEDARRGYFTGLDGRLVMFPSAHHILAGYLQNGESVVMKKACSLWHSELHKLGVPFIFRNDVHDEWQTETEEEYADVVGKTQSWSIQKVGEEFGLNCALAGKYVVGTNWRETH